MMQTRLRPQLTAPRRAGLRLALLAFATTVATALGASAAEEPSWDDYLDHAYVYSAADTTDLRTLIEIGRAHV